MLKLYDYFRSSAAFRVRITLNYKEILFEKITVNLLNNEQSNASYLRENPFGLVPTLVTSDGNNIHQSLSIIEYLELTYPDTKRLFPCNITDLIYVKSIAYDIAMDIHPLNNRRVLNYLVDELEITVAKKNTWYQHWIHTGLIGLEQFIKSSGKFGKFCLGDELSIADVVLVPQMYNAKRFNCNLNDYPIINKINENCLQLPAVINAFPQE
jgi:maleylacetoacetate isomerase